MFDKMRMASILTRHEGLRLRPYKDSEGILTIGVGRNLEDVGISESEAQHMLNNDIQDAYMGAMMNFPTFRTINGPRKRVIVNMVFNLGITRLLRFRKMRAALAGYDYEEAAKEMLDSKWAEQVGQRAIELAEVMRTGYEHR